MNAPAPIKPTSSATPIAAFKARCEALGLLVRMGEEDLHDAVDRLQADAERSRLVAEYGQDHIQHLMATAFADAAETTEAIDAYSRRMRAAAAWQCEHQAPGEHTERVEPTERPIPETTIEALAYALRCGLACFDDAGNRDRLRRCDFSDL